MNIAIQLFQIITLQRRPSDLEYDQFAAIFYIGMSIGVGYLANSLSKIYSQPLAYSLVQGLAQVTVLYAALAVNQKSQRFVQTCTALFGVSALLGCSIILLALVPGLGIISYFLLGWQIYVIVLIFKDAFECSPARAVFIAIFLYLLPLLILTLIFPSIAEELQPIIDELNALLGSKGQP